MTQIQVLQNINSPKENKRKNIDQVKFTKKTSGAEQPADVGNLYPRERHHACCIAGHTLYVPFEPDS